MGGSGILEVKTEKLHLFLQDGFFNGDASTVSMHAHGYTEIHLVVQGSIRFAVGQTEYALTSGDILAIPQNTYHYCVRRDGGTRTVAFQIENRLRQMEQCHVSPTLAEEFAQTIKAAREHRDYRLVVKYIDLFCNSFFEEEKLPAFVSTDSALIISEFFSNRYQQQITLADLARELNLSEKQTERMVKKYTGNTFVEELTRRRIHAANFLIRSSGMTMGQIAESVGFRSYSGFWKAYKKQTLKTEASDRALPKEVE